MPFGLQRCYQLCCDRTVTKFGSNLYFNFNINSDIVASPQLRELKLGVKAQYYWIGPKLYLNPESSAVRVSLFFIFLLYIFYFILRLAKAYAILKHC